MSISNTDTYAGPFHPNGETTAFPFEFVVFETGGAAELRVIRLAADGTETQFASGDYTVTLGPSGGGTVTFAVAPATGDPLYIVSDPGFAQTIAFANQAPFLPTVVNEALDRIATRVLNVKSVADRGLVVPIDEPGLLVPSVPVRAGKLIGFDDSGNLLVSVSHEALIAVAAQAAEDRRLAEEAAQQAAAIAIAARPIRTVSADYTITAADLGYVLRVDSASTTNIYVPQYPVLPVGFWVDIEQFGAGSVYILADVDATVQSLGGQNKISGQYGQVRVIVDTESSVNLSGDLSGTGSVGWIIAARIGSEGWYIDIDMASSRAAGAINLQKLADCLTVTSEGYTATAGTPGSVTLGTVTRTLTITEILRKSYTLQNEKQIEVTGDIVTLRCVLSDFVFDDDRDGGAGTSGTDPVLVVEPGWWIDGPRTAPGQTVTVTNNSIEDYPTVNGHWNIPPFLISSDYSNSFPLEFVGVDGFARDGRTCAVVQFDATGATSAVTASAVAVDLTISTFPATARSYPAISFAAAISDAAFTQGETVHCRARAYPHVGDADAILDTSAFSFGNTNLPANYPMVCDKSGTYGRLYAAYDPVAGNDGTGVVSTTRATAVATPFASFQRACYALQTQSSTDYSRANLGNHVIVATGAGPHSINMPAVATSIPPATLFAYDDCGAMSTWMYLDADPGAYLVADSNGANKKVPPITCISVPFAPTGTGSDHIIVRGVDSSSTASQHVWVRNTTMDGASDNSNNMINSIGFQYFSGVLANSPGRVLLGNGSYDNNIILMRNSDLVNVTAKGGAMMLNGVKAKNITDTYGDTATGSSAYPTDGLVMINVGFFNVSLTTLIAVSLALPRARGSALVNVLIEGTSPGASAFMRISGDGNLSATKQHYIYNLGGYGEAITHFRMNAGYEDGTTMTANNWWNGVGQGKKHIRLKGCILFEFNFKTDVFALNGNNVHTWAVGYHVGFEHNAYLNGDSENVRIPGPGVHIGEVLQDSEFVTGVWGSTAFTDWKAANGLGGDGDYKPKAGYDAYNVMPIGAWPCKFDLLGGERRNDGTGSLGPIES